MDYHLHTDYSIDGEMIMEDACNRAIAKGLEEIAFTDHIDLDWPDPNFIFNISDMDQYIQEIETNRTKFKGRLQIRTGIEIGLQPHVLDETAQIINKYPFDFVIASIHIIDRKDPYTGDYYIDKNKEDSYRIYYEEILDLIKKFDDFDVLGHIGYIKRYFPSPYETGDELLCMDLIEDILKTIILKGKGIEVNTSGYAHISKCPMPPFEIIKKYRDLGGTIITIGSDAHKIENVGYEISSGLEEIKRAGFNHVNSFVNRNPIYLGMEI